MAYPVTKGYPTLPRYYDSPPSPAPLSRSYRFLPILCSTGRKVKEKEKKGKKERPSIRLKFGLKSLVQIVTSIIAT